MPLYCQHLHELRKTSVATQTYQILRQTSSTDYKSRISVQFKIKNKIVQNCQIGVRI
jgi:hypothetical protein